jgi:hypothetical protein
MNSCGNLGGGDIYSDVVAVIKGSFFAYSNVVNLFPCGGGVEYLHRSPATCRRRQKQKSQIWDSKVWSRVPRYSDPRMNAVNDRPILSSESMLYKDYNRKCSLEKKNSGREFQGALRQDELIGGGPPVVK